MRFFALCLAVIGFSGPALAQNVPVPQVIETAVREVIQPGFNQFALDAEHMVGSMASLCATPGEETLTRARANFGYVVESFSRVEFVRFGPLTADNRYERLLFWPDRKGIALRQVQAILAKKDMSAIDPETLRGKSVAVQGLNALEYVLFGTDAELLAQKGEDGAFRCEYGLAIAALVSAVSGEINAEWQDEAGIAARLMAPSAENADYRTEREALEALTGALAHGIEAIRDVRLLPFMSADGQNPKPKSALFWRSGLTVPSMRANFEGIATLFDRSQIGQATDAENLWVDEGAKFEFANALRAADAVTLPVEEALADERQKKALGYMLILTRSLQTLVGENLAAALNLSVGFSSLDGD